MSDNMLMPEKKFRGEKKTTINYNEPINYFGCETGPMAIALYFIDFHIISMSIICGRSKTKNDRVIWRESDPDDVQFKWKYFHFGKKPSYLPRSLSKRSGMDRWSHLINIPNICQSFNFINSPRNHETDIYLFYYSDNYRQIKYKFPICEWKNNKKTRPKKKREKNLQNGKSGGLTNPNMCT